MVAVLFGNRLPDGSNFLDNCILRHGETSMTSSGVAGLRQQVLHCDRDFDLLARVSPLDARGATVRRR
jgi:hypothetical protein